MGSMHWTTEESRYLKAIFAWQDRSDAEQDGGTRVQDATIKACAGDLRVLIVGAQGVGKTALLTRFCDDAFADEPDERFTHGGRRPVRIDELLYNMDVLEMPAQHLVEAANGTDGTSGTSGKDVEDNNAAQEWPVFGTTAATRRGRSNCPQRAAQSPAAMMLEQALAITEAAIVVYDVCSPVSFQQASCLYERLLHAREREQQKEDDDDDDDEEQHQQLRSSRASSKSKKQPTQRSLRFRSRKRQMEQTTALHSSHSPKPLFRAPPPPRPFALLLVGNKSDVDDSERRVAWADGSKVAGSNGFLEASAKENDKVDDVFVQIGREILRQRAEANNVQGRAATSDSQDTMDRKSSSASSSKALSVLGLGLNNNNQTPRRPFLLRVLSLSFGRRSRNAPVAV